jgi:hypothetical protein
MSSELLDTLLRELDSGNNEFVNAKLNELTDEQIDALFSDAQAFKSIGPASTDKVVVASVSNLREQYLKKLLTTALVSFLFQMKDEYTVDAEELTSPPNKEDYMEEVANHVLPEDFDKNTFYHNELVAYYKQKFPDQENVSISEMEEALTEDELLELSSKGNAELLKLTTPEKKLNAMLYNDAVEAAIKTQSDSERIVIDKFLGWLFKFNKDKHEQKGETPVADDPERKDLEELKGTDVVYDNIPPNDTHCRFTSYYEINYDKLREATKNIYNIKPDLEHAMIVYDVVNNQEEANTFIRKYASSSKYDILSFNLNRWTLLGAFKENRERVDYYNKHNSIIKALLEQQETDNQLAEDLMKKRVKSTKVKAEKVFGKDSPSFDEYRKLSPAELETKYNATVEEIGDDKIKVTREAIVDAETGETLTLDEDGVPTNALEVPITTINAKTGEVSQSRIFTRADES